MEQPRHPYPAAEHLPEPVTMADRLHEELRTSGEGGMLRDNVLLGLGAIYGETKLASSLYVYSELLARVDHRSHQDDQVLTAKMQMIYTGALMAIHVGVSSPYVTARKQILGEELGGVNEILDGNGIATGLIVRHLDQVRQAVPDIMTREYTVEDQLAVAEFVQRAFSDVGDDVASQQFGDDLQFGYVYGTYVTNKLKQRYHPPLVQAL